MGAHTIITKARARARTKRTILALSVAVALLVATASTASAEGFLTPWYCPPTPSQSVPAQQTYDCHLDQQAFGAGTSFDFGNRQVGTTSPAQRFALLVYPRDTFDPSISVSGDYAQTNDCPPTLSATGGQIKGCFINVTFAPTGTEPKGGTLSTGPGGPTGTLTGNGVTTRTPPALPLRVSVDLDEAREHGSTALCHGQHNKLHFAAFTSNDSTLVARGDIKKTKKQVLRGGPTEIKAKLKHPKRLRKAGGPKKGKLARAEVKVKATDEFGQTATKKFEVRLLGAASVYCG